MENHFLLYDMYTIQPIPVILQADVILKKIGSLRVLFQLFRLISIQFFKESDFFVVATQQLADTLAKQIATIHI